MASFKDYFDLIEQDNYVICIINVKSNNRILMNI